MVVVGLTGGIASGKSTVSQMLAALGAEVIDADRLAREAVLPGTTGWEEVVARFGPEVLGPGGEIDRPRLGARVFADPAARSALEAIVHPRVAAATDRRLAEIARCRPEAVVVLDVPLLFETGMHRTGRLAAVVVVWVPEAIQLERLMARDGIGAAEARARLAAQMPIDRKKALADRVIDNSGTLEETRAQALALYAWLAELAVLRAERGGG